MKQTDKLIKLHHSVYMNELPSLPFFVDNIAVLFVFESDVKENKCHISIADILVCDNDGNVKRIGGIPNTITVLPSDVEEPEWYPIDYIEMVGEMSKTPKCIDDVRDLILKADYSLMFPLYEAVEEYIRKQYF